MIDSLMFFHFQKKKNKLVITEDFHMNLAVDGAAAQIFGINEKTTFRTFSFFQN